MHRFYWSVFRLIKIIIDFQGHESKTFPDATLIAKSTEKLEQLLDKVEEVSSDYGLISTTEKYKF